MNYGPEKQEKAKQLRRLGKSLNEIREKLRVSKSTASIWCKDVEVSRQGKQRLLRRWERGYEKGLRNISKEKSKEQWGYRKIRIQAYEQGLSSHPTHEDALCIGLYWGEGTKYRSLWTFVNSDRESIALMVRWAIRAGQNPDAFGAHVQIHPEDNLTNDDVIDFWTEAGIPRENIRVYRIRSCTSNGKRSGKTPYGTCQLRSIKRGAWLYSYYEGQREAIKGKYDDDHQGHNLSGGRRP
jgi:hypothetical protein